MKNALFALLILGYLLCVWARYFLGASFRCFEVVNYFHFIRNSLLPNFFLISFGHSLLFSLILLNITKNSYWIICISKIRVRLSSFNNSKWPVVM